MDPKRTDFAKSLVAGAVSAIGVSFIGGCFYPYVMMKWLSQNVAKAPPTYDDLTISTTLEFGIIIAAIALPVIIVLTVGLALPLFRLWIRRGYASVAAFAAGGVIIATVGASIISVLHFAADFLVTNDYLFALVLIGTAGPVAGIVIWYWSRHATNQAS